MASVFKLPTQREAATICRDLRDARATVAGYVADAADLDDDGRLAWDRADDRVTNLRAELDAALLNQLGVGLEQIREAIS